VFVLQECFSTPYMPFVPLLGLAINSYMMAQLHWQAWVRLAVVTLGVCFGYAWQARGDSGASNGAGSGGQSDESKEHLLAEGRASEMSPLS
jgi:hypothetical protein